MKKPQINELIIIKTEEEWYLIQKYLFSIGYTWCNGSKKIITCNSVVISVDGIFNTILIEMNHQDYYSPNLMFSYNADLYDSEKITKASYYLRQYKLKRILYDK